LNQRRRKLHALNEGGEYMGLIWWMITSPVSFTKALLSVSDEPGTGGD
jgi:hypothetical protein